MPLARESPESSDEEAAQGTGVEELAIFLGSPHVAILWMDKIHFAPPSKAWEDDFPASANQTFVFSMVSTSCSISSIHSMFRPETKQRLNTFFLFSPVWDKDFAETLAFQKIPTDWKPDRSHTFWEGPLVARSLVWGQIELTVMKILYLGLRDFKPCVSVFGGPQELASVFLLVSIQLPQEVPCRTEKNEPPRWFARGWTHGASKG